MIRLGLALFLLSLGLAPAQAQQLPSRPTYYAATLPNAYTAYATPTDLSCIYGSASKTTIIMRFGMSMHSTANAAQVIDFVKRSTVDTGGTPTSLTPTALDTYSPSPGASMTTYAAAPTTGTSIGIARTVEQASTTAGTTPGIASICGATYLPCGVTTISFETPIILHSTTEGLCMNYRGAALTAGFTATIFAEWIEQ